MSDAHDHDDDHDDDAHDDHAFDGEPAKELGPDEAPTPGWLPAVGAAIFVLAGIYFLAGSDAAGSGSGAAAQAPAPPSTAPQIVATAMPARQPPAAPAAASGAPANAGAVDAIRRMSPDQIKDLQRRIQDAAQKAKPPGADGAK